MSSVCVYVVKLVLLQFEILLTVTCIRFFSPSGVSEVKVELSSGS